MSYLEELYGLVGKTAALTGGGGAIAGALAEALLAAGANVSLWDHKQSNSDRAAERLTASVEGSRDRVLPLEADATSESDIAKALEAAEGRFGAVDILVNCAGGNRGRGSFLDLDLAQFESVIRLNLLGGIVVPTKVVAGRWVERKMKGSIVNLCSMASYIPLSGIWAYDAAKAATLNLTMATAKELAPHGIRVNALAPGFFIGKQNRDLLLDKEGNLTERGRSIVSRTPLQRFGEVAELAGAVLFLASERASGFVTGMSLPVDGGFLVDNI